MIRIPNYDWVLVISVLVFAALLIIFMACLLFVCNERNELKEKNTLKKSILLLVLNATVAIAVMVGGYSFIKNKNKENFNIIKTLEIQEVHRNENSRVVQGYFSDEEGIVYVAELTNLPIEIKTNINATKYEMIVENDKATIISPYTKDSLSYAKEKEYFFIFNPCGDIIIIISSAFLFVLMFWICFALILMFLDTLNLWPPKYVFRCLIVISIVFVIWCGVYGFNYTKEQRQENIETLKQMDIILKDDRDVYAIDSDGLLYKYDEAEFLEDFRYKVEMKEFLKLNEDIYIPFQNLE